MNRKLIFGIILGAVAFIGLLVWLTLPSGRYRAEVCMEFRGRSACRTASAATRELAVRTATDNACAMIASGMTDSMACTATPPRSVRDLQ